jgi:sulfoxide reductase heme-binding subunit YedZ
LQLIWPWQNRSRRFSALKAATFALMFAPGLWLAWQLAAGDFGILPMAYGSLIYWSGVWATGVLWLALAVTPAMRIFRWPALVDVRRMVGVAALAYTIAHLVLWFPLRSWNWAFIGNEMMTRLTLMVATLSTIGLVALGVTSVDAAIARMGAKGWQRLHNAVYAVSALALAHVLLSRGNYPEQYLLTGIFFWLMVWRLLDRYKRGADAAALATLALVTCLVTALTEAVRAWLTRGYELSWSLGNNFTLELGIPPAWEVLVLGLAIALLAALRQAPLARPAPLAARKAAG